MRARNTKIYPRKQQISDKNLTNWASLQIYFATDSGKKIKKCNSKQINFADVRIIYSLI